jgi:Family of unknown function (DUF5683)
LIEQRKKCEMKLLKLLCLLGACFLLHLPQAWTQNQVDTTLLVEENVIMDSVFQKKQKRLPVPKRALLYSFALPGSGQVYNGNWWKTPFMTGGLGFLIYRIGDTEANYRDFRDAVQKKLRNEPHKFTGKSFDNLNSLRVIRDRFDRQRQLSYVYAVGAYGLIALEAYVDAHLQNYDISEDLSMRLKPVFGPVPQGLGMQAGIGLAFTF